VEPAVQVTDVRALRALAHPLRSRLLGLLRLHGPATASQLGRAVGESSGSTSYHLRQLAAYGFVEEVEGEGTARERWWRARHRLTSWRADDIEAQEGGAEV
jgi:DNA-binding transcriptional ArsR family regulator